jgi:N-methylhydantoinase A
VSIRCAIDSGGTFTDLVVEDADGGLTLFKQPTTPDDPVVGVLEVLSQAAGSEGLELAEFLGGIEILIHGTTRSTNAVLTGTTARTALVVTEGHPDTLVFREGGRLHPFDWSEEYPEPYIPRALTFELSERIGSEGEVVRALDEDQVREVAARLSDLEVGAVAVCLLWSIVNAAHEQRVGALLSEHLPGVPVVLSHQLNPVLREYRRASSAAIDASLRPLMSSYLGSLEDRLHAAGFTGRLLMVSTTGGLMEAADMARTPILSINSGPAMAPVAGRQYAQQVAAETAIVADTGGTSYDVSLVRGGRIPMTREAWLGEQYTGHITGFPAVDVRSIGAGGGSIAWVDDGGLLHVGPRSAGSEPGPVAYGRGGLEPTVTDASLVLGYLSPDSFLGGQMSLDGSAAAAAISERVAERLGLPLLPAAAAVMSLATEHMVQAIDGITVAQGVDPRSAVLVGGGGAAGFNAVAIARRLGCPSVLIPPTSPALSAVGALISDLTTEYSAPVFAESNRFVPQRVDSVLVELEQRCEAFRARLGAPRELTTVAFTAEARYSSEVWQIDLPLRGSRLSTPEELNTFTEDFGSLHEELYGVRDTASPVFITGLRARVSCALGHRTDGALHLATNGRSPKHRQAYFPPFGELAAEVRALSDLRSGESLPGPAIVESAYATVVIDPGAVATLLPSGGLVIDPEAAQ